MPSFRRCSASSLGLGLNYVALILLFIGLLVTALMLERRIDYIENESLSVNYDISSVLGGAEIMKEELETIRVLKREWVHMKEGFNKLRKELKLYKANYTAAKNHCKGQLMSSKQLSNTFAESVLLDDTYWISGGVQEYESSCPVFRPAIEEIAFRKCSVKLPYLCEYKTGYY